MRSFTLAALALATAGAAAAQPNPFALQKSNAKPAHVRYTMAGDLTGTGEFAQDGDRMVDRSTVTGKFFGKTSTTERYTLTTRDSIYSADLTKKTGTAMPNVLPLMAKEYDKLDGGSKKRLHANMKEMSDMLAQAFGTGSLLAGADKGERKTIAGEECDERSVAGWSICSAVKAPGVALQVKGSLMCLDYEQTATEVQIGSAPGSAFEKPAGVTFGPDPNLQNPDSMARGFVGYLASKALSDSIAAAKAKIEEQKEAAAEGKEPTPEEKAQMQQACEALKNFSVGRMMSGAATSFASELGKAAADEAKRGVEGKVREGVRGIFKR